MKIFGGEKKREGMSSVLSWGLECLGTVLDKPGGECLGTRTGLFFLKAREADV